MAPTSTVKRYVRELARRALAPAPARAPEGTVTSLLELAEDHVAPTTAAAGTRLRGAKLSLLRLARLWTHDQEQFNVAVLDAIRDVDRRVGGTPPPEFATILAALEAEAAEQRSRVEELELALARSDARLAATGRQSAELVADVRILRSRVDMVLHEARSAVGGTMDDQQLGRLSAELDREFDQLYESFEDTFRGTRDQVKVLVAEYLPDVVDLEGPLLDIGCGRGEWLEVLGDHGIEAYGVDVNERFVELNEKRGSRVVVGDAIAHLSSLDDASLGGVSALHVVEHLPLEAVVRLLDEALRAVKPGGLLLFETPNPTNLVVGAAGFYLDPTHLRPMHPTLLSFLVESRGFVDVETRFLHPAESDAVPELGGSPRAAHLAETMQWVLFGPQDYAILARRPGRG